MREVLDNYQRAHLRRPRDRADDGGDLRFVDAPEVARTAERGVTLTIDAAAVQQLPPPEKGPPPSHPRGGGRLSRLLGGGWKKK